MEIRETGAYADWFAALRDRRAKARILSRLRRLELGNPGDVAPVGEGVSEMKIDYGPGYRIYFMTRGHDLAILLGGGDKGSQDRDIRSALSLARQIRDGDDGD